MFKDLQKRFTAGLLWSEKYTKTDMLYLALGGSLSIFGQAVGIVSSLALAVAVSHLVPKETYGTYKFVLSAVTMLSFLSLNSIGSAVFQSAAHGFDGALHKGFWENIRWSVGIFIGTVVLALYYFLNSNTTLAIGILIGGSFSPFIASASLFGPFLGGKKDFFRQTMYGIVDGAVPIGIFIGVILITHNTIILIATYFVTNALAALYFYRRTILVYHANMHLHDEGMLTYSKHLSAMGIVSGVAGNLDQILLFHYVGAAQLALYSFALAIPEQLKGPIKNMGAMMQARFVNRTGHEIESSMRNKTFLLFIAGAVMTALYVAVAPTIFHVLFPKYIDAAWYSQIYALWMLAIAFEPAGAYLSAKKLTTELYVSNIAYSVCQIILLFLGVIVWGLLGVVLARVVARSLIYVLNYVLYRRAVRREIAAIS